MDTNANSGASGATDTSSVTAAASTWDSLYQLGTQTLDKAVTVKLTRTLAIIPITLVLAFVRTRKAGSEGKKSSLKRFSRCLFSTLCWLPSSQQSQPLSVFPHPYFLLSKH